MPCSSYDQENMKQPLSAQGEAQRGILRLTAPRVKPVDVARYMGLPDLDQPGAEIEHAIRTAIVHSEPLLKPIAVWSLVPIVSSHPDRVEVLTPEKNLLSIPCTSTLLRGISHLQLSLITLGAGLEKLLQQLYEEDPLTAMACDAVGSAVLAMAGAAFIAKRQSALKQMGLELTITFVPGCQAFPLSAQTAIFKVLQAEQIGVRLSDACLMHPAKSATSVAPVAAELPVWMKKVSPCRLCNLYKTCRFKATKA
ncbi:MAG TPA: hypothetical protein GXZ82_08420 [Firmicutes bacterium]|jgi:hypothetical protein|nr:hypothetical protein [Bacillota bacterium]